MRPRMEQEKMNDRRGKETSESRKDAVSDLVEMEGMKPCSSTRVKKETR